LWKKGHEREPELVSSHVPQRKGRGRTMMRWLAMGSSNGRIRGEQTSEQRDGFFYVDKDDGDRRRQNQAKLAWGARTCPSARRPIRAASREGQQQ